MKASEIFASWGKLLSGGKPILSIEITRECPLRCPGCYPYEPEHLGAAGPLRELDDLKGEPLVRCRELDVLLPQLSKMNIHVQLVTSAVRPIPRAWRDLPNIFIVVSIDGLQPEHDCRRTPATYERILKHIAGHRIVVHCTVTGHFAARPGYLAEFARFWSAREEVRKIWFSLYTPQEGEKSQERLSPQDRATAIAELARLSKTFEKIDLPKLNLDGLVQPPSSPEECMFARTSACLSADLSTRVAPCQFGGRPVCTECGCIASAGLAAVGRYKLAGLVKVSDLISFSMKIGERFRCVGAGVA